MAEERDVEEDMDLEFMKKKEVNKGLIKVLQEDLQVEKLSKENLRKRVNELES